MRLPARPSKGASLSFLVLALFAGTIQAATYQNSATGTTRGSAFDETDASVWLIRNFPPIAQDDAFTVAEDSIDNVLAVKADNGNGVDSDPDGDSLSIVAVGPTDNGGTVSINDNGTPGDTTDDFIEYTPAPNFSGVETFSYTIDDGNGETSVATVTVTVTPSNDPPIAQDDAFNVLAGTTANQLDVLADNGSGPDSDPDGGGLSIISVGPTDNGGTVSINDNGTPGDTTDDFIEYTPAPGFFGTETFPYTIEDADGRTASAVVTVTVAGTTATSVLAEISPNTTSINLFGQSFVYDVLPEITTGNTGVQRVDISAPAGYMNLLVTSVEVDGVPLANNCPSPGAGEYCGSTTGNAMTVVLGTKVITDQVNIRILFDADTPGFPGSGDFASAVRDGSLPQLDAIPGNADGDALDANSITVDVGQSQGLLLQIAKAANKREALVGGVVTYSIEIRNSSAAAISDVFIADQTPPNFKYVAGSVRLNGAPTAEPTGGRPLVFDVGTVPGFVDEDGNNQVDPGEPGYVVLVYQLVVGSGAIPGTYTNRAIAWDVCDTCFISNETTAQVEVGIDPLFDLATIIGKVFHDRNRDDRQDPDEPGVGQAMVALDDGTYALSDEHGRFHFPAVAPGHRMLKINLHSLPPGSKAATATSHVVWVSPGLIARVNFGVIVADNSESIGRMSVPGLSLESTQTKPPIDVRGNVEALSVLVNGLPIALPSEDVRLGVERLEEHVRFVGDQLDQPMVFSLGVERPEQIDRWRLSILSGQGEPLHASSGTGAPPAEVAWDGRGDNGKSLESAGIGQYQLDVWYQDGSKASSPRRLFGVNRVGIISLGLTGEAFESGRAELSDRARNVLRQAAEILRLHPDEKVVIEGHTDSVGSSESNLDLARRRARAAADYLVQGLGLPADQFTIGWYGEERPIAPNATPEGRALNRRVEVKGDVTRDDAAEILDQYRTSPSARINGAPVTVVDRGRFGTSVANVDGPIEIELSDAQGRSVTTSVAVPDVDIVAPSGSLVIPYGNDTGACVASETDGAPVVKCRVSGLTQRNNTLEIDGRPIEIDPDGSFATDVDLRPGSNLLGIVVRNAAGLSRIANLTVQVTDRAENGDLLLVTASVPNLTVNLPPDGVKLTASRWNYSGATDPGNRVEINGQAVEVAGNGSFDGAVELPRGASRLIVRATSPDGTTGTIEREVEVARHELFLLALADGKFGKMSGDGYIEGAGLDEEDDYYTEGRLAFYLKGVISGKYLITAAFDSGQVEADELFRDLDGEATQRLLTNLDPDKFYPVYGDSSTVVYDVESDGKFYLGLDSEEIHLLVGNYSLSLDDTELAAYRRTLYGGNFAYQSLARSKYGAPDTQVAVFGAEVRQVHVRDELLATGGSIYYLSQRDLVEGSEEIVLLVRDQNTGLVLRRDPQRRNVDYLIKYPEGRVMFQRPIASVVESGTIANQNILSGNRVFIQVDYESLQDGFDKTGSGGRIRKQLGDHVAVGGTYIDDETASGSYELTAFDAELRVGKNTRFTAEIADSRGTDSRSYVSEDGGLSYTPAAAVAAAEGSAWKAAAELDLGEWFGRPDRYQVNLFYKELEPNFFSSGNLLEQGTQKMGAHASLEVSRHDSLQLRYDREERTGGGIDPAATGESAIESLQWLRRHERWGLGVEYFSKDTEDDLTGTSDRDGLGAMRFWVKLTEQLQARLDHQQTLTGDPNDQTSLGLEYQLLPSLALDARATDGQTGQSAQAGLVFTHHQSKIYLTERLDDSQSGRKTTTIVGSRAPLGPSSQVYTEYQWEDSDQSGKRALSLLGAQRQWEPEQGLAVLVGGEVANVDDGSGSSNRTAVSGSVSYARPEEFKLQSRQEVRLEDGTTDRIQYFTVNQFDYSVNPATTVLARYRYSKTRDRDTNDVESRFEERTVGVAFRPVQHDRLNTIAKYTRLFDQRPLNLGGDDPTRTTMDVVSLEATYEINRHVEWWTKEAFRMQRESTSDLPSVETETLLTIQRFNVNLWKPLDVGVEYRILTEREADDRREGWLGELTWRLMQNFRAGIGYNFTDFTDDDLSQNDYSVRGWFFRVQGHY